MKTAFQVVSKRAAGVAAIAFLFVAASGCIDISYSGTSSGSYSVSGANGSYKYSANKDLDGTFAADIKSIDIDNQLGEVHVRAAGDGETAGWKWKLKVAARTDAAAQDLVKQSDCQSEAKGSDLKLAVTLPKKIQNANLSSDLEVLLPKSVAVRASNRFGATRIYGMNADVKASNQSGSVEIKDIAGKVQAETSFATLTVENVGPATLNNQSGKIEAKTIHGAIDAKTSFGNLVVMDAGAANLRDQSGSIEAGNIQGDLTMESSFGSLKADNISGAVTARNQSGRIEVSKVKGDAELRSSFGEIRAKGIGGNLIISDQSGRVSAEQVAGSVKADNTFGAMEISSSGKKVACHNQSGSIRIDSTTVIDSEIVAETSFGSLEVHLPAGTRPDIQAHTTFGNVESDFPVNNAGAKSGALAEEPEVSVRMSLKNQNGAAILDATLVPSVRVNLKNQSGSIRVIRDKALAER